jgi:hypothetical protein
MLSLLAVGIRGCIFKSLPERKSVYTGSSLGIGMYLFRLFREQ